MNSIPAIATTSAAIAGQRLAGGIDYRTRFRGESTGIDPGLEVAHAG